MPTPLSPEDEAYLRQRGYSPEELLTEEEAIAAKAQTLNPSLKGTFVRAIADTLPGLATGAGAWKAFTHYAPKVLPKLGGVPLTIGAAAAGGLGGALGQMSVEGISGGPIYKHLFSDPLEAAALQQADRDKNLKTRIAATLLPQLGLGKFGYTAEARSGIPKLLGLSKAGRNIAPTQAEKVASAATLANPAIAAGMGIGAPLLQGQDVPWAETLPQLGMAIAQGRPLFNPRQAKPVSELRRPKTQSKGPTKVGDIADTAPEVSLTGNLPETGMRIPPTAIEQIPVDYPAGMLEAQNQLATMQAQIARNAEVAAALKKSAQKMAAVQNKETAQRTASGYSLVDKRGQPKAPSGPEGELVQYPELVTPLTREQHPTPRVIQISPKEAPAQRVIEGGELVNPEPLQRDVDPNTEVPLPHAKRTLAVGDKQLKIGAKGTQAKYQPAPPGIDPNDPANAEIIGAYNDAMDIIAQRRGAKINRSTTPIIAPDKSRRPGAYYPRENIADTARIDVDTSRENSTTQPHELSHAELENLSRYGTVWEKRLARQMLERYAGDEEKLVEGAARLAKDRPLPAKMEDVSPSPDSKLKVFWDSWRNRFGLGNKESLTKALADKMLNDPSFAEKQASAGVAKATTTPGAKFQDAGDYEEYQRLKGEMQRKIQADEIDDEFQTIWKASEDIKNRNGGMPPEGPKYQGEEYEANKPAIGPDVSDRVKRKLAESVKKAQTKEAKFVTSAEPRENVAQLPARFPEYSLTRAQVLERSEIKNRGQQRVNDIDDRIASMEQQISAYPAPRDWDKQTSVQRQALSKMREELSTTKLQRARAVYDMEQASEAVTRPPQTGKITRTGIADDLSTLSFPKRTIEQLTEPAPRPEYPEPAAPKEPTSVERNTWESYLAGKSPARFTSEILDTTPGVLERFPRDPNTVPEGFSPSPEPPSRQVVRRPRRMTYTQRSEYYPSFDAEKAATIEQLKLQTGGAVDPESHNQKVVEVLTKLNRSQQGLGDNFTVRDAALALGVDKSRISRAMKGWNIGDPVPGVLTKGFKDTLPAKEFKKGWDIGEEPSQEAAMKVIDSQAKKFVARHPGVVDQNTSDAVNTMRSEIVNELQMYGKDGDTLQEAAQRMGERVVSRYKDESARNAERLVPMPDESDLPPEAGDDSGTARMPSENVTNPADRLEPLGEGTPQQWIDDISSNWRRLDASQLGLLDHLKTLARNPNSKNVKLTEQDLVDWLDKNVRGPVKIKEQAAVIKRELNEPKFQDATEGEDRSPWTPDLVNFSNRGGRYEGPANQLERQQLKDPNRIILPAAIEKTLGTVSNSLVAEHGRSGEVVADKLPAFFAQVRRDSAGHYNKFVMAAQGYSRAEMEQVYKVLIAESRAQRSYQDHLPQDLQQLYVDWRNAYTDMGQEALDAGQPVMTPEGGTRDRILKEHAFANMTRVDVIDEIIARPDSAKSRALKEDFINHQIKLLGERRNIGAEQARGIAEERYTNFTDALRNINTKGDSAVFSGNRKVEGIGLPDSWIDPDPLNALKRYTTRYAFDRAYYDQIESDPLVMKALDKSKDYYNRPVAEPSENISPIGGEDVRFIEEILQGKANKYSPGVDATAGLVNTLLTPGFTTGVWDNITTIKKQLGFAASSGDAPAVLKAYAKAVIEDIIPYYAGRREPTGAMARSMDTGFTRLNRHLMEDHTEIATKWNQRLNNWSNFIRYWNGRQMSETVSRTLAQAGGEVIAHAERIAALNGDENSISFMRKLVPEGGWEGMSIAELGTRTGEMVQGKYDATELPRWVFDSHFAPFGRLMRWNIGQGNNFVKHLIQPIRENPGSIENWSRLFTATLGSTLAGFAIAEMKERLNNKKLRLPTWKEIGGANEKQTQALLWKLAVTSEMSGTFGAWSSLAAMAANKLSGESAMGFGFPLVEGSEKILKETASYISALQSDMSLENLTDITPTYFNNVAKAIIGGWNVVEGAASRANPKGDLATNRRIADQSRDRKIYDMTQRGRITDSAFYGADYSRLPERSFKRGSYPTQKETDRIADRVIQRSHGRGTELVRELEGLEQMPIKSMPSYTSNREEFMRYARWIRDTQGEDKLRALVKDYVTRTEANDVKKQLLEGTIRRKLGFQE